MMINVYEPKENFADGLLSLDLPELEQKRTGKVRDLWDISGNRKVIVTTDRQSAYDRMICTVPNKGKVLNMMAAFWFQKTSHIVKNHLLEVPHPYASIVKSIKDVLPVEVVLRKYMAKSATSTSLCYNYFVNGRREIYGYSFPDELKENEVLPMGTVVTPTTKNDEHDLELTDIEAKEIIKKELGKDIWDQVKSYALEIFKIGEKVFDEAGLILVDTKYEFGIDESGEIILIDEIHTPDSSRIWLKESYKDRTSQGLQPENFDKEILRRWLAEHNFRGEGPVPLIDKEIIEKMSVAYTRPYEMVTGEKLDIEEVDLKEMKEKILNSVLTKG